MPRGYDRPLYIQPFDHRGSFQTKMFGWESPLSDWQTAEIAAAKRVIYDGFLAALAAGVPKEKASQIAMAVTGARRASRHRRIDKCRPPPRGTGAGLHISEGVTGTGDWGTPSSESKLDAGVSFHQHLVIPDCIRPGNPHSPTSATTKAVPAAYLVPISVSKPIKTVPRSA
jgi:hypothetical protein